MFANIICIFALFVSLSRAGYAGSYGGNYIGAGGAGGYGYGYGGDFPSYPPAPFYPPIPFDFGTLMAGLSQLQARLQQQAAAHAPLGGGGGGGAGGYAFSGSYPAGPSYGPRTFSTPVSPPISNGHQGGGGGGGYGPTYATGFSSGGGYGGGYGYSGGYGGSGGAGGYAKTPIPLSLGAYPGGYSSGASATFGGDGIKQTAFLSPENPASPNVNVRFGGGSVPLGGNSKSVYVSSSSASGNINGTPYHQRHASTTVNDNGKVSSYTVHDK